MMKRRIRKLEAQNIDSLHRADILRRLQACKTADEEVDFFADLSEVDLKTAWDLRFPHDEINWRAVPTEMLKQIVEDPDVVDFDELRKQYPRK